MTRVALVTPWNVNDPRAWSGVVQPMTQSLAQHCELVPVSTQAVPDALLDRALARLLDRRWGRSYLVGHALATSLKRGAALDRRLQQVHPDVVVAVAASQDIAFSRSGIPVIQVSDTTLKAISGYYGLFTDVHSISQWQAQVIAAFSSRRASHTLAATDWAREALVRDDKIPTHAVSVAPFGPAIRPGGKLGPRPSSGPTKVLSVVSDWDRKGGDRVVRVFEALRARNVPCEFTIVGRTPQLPSGIHAPGVIGRDELAAMYRSHDVLLELARSNAAGVTLTDAAGFGLPAIATRTGGVPTIVADGVSGILVDNTDEAAITAAVDAIAQGRSELNHLSRGAEERAATVLNWDAWSATTLRVAESVVGGHDA